MTFILVILWILIGLIVGLVANWLGKACRWPWFWLDLLIAVLGAIIFAYVVGLALFGPIILISAWSLVLALFGAVNFLLFTWLLRKLFK